MKPLIAALMILPIAIAEGPAHAQAAMIDNSKAPTVAYDVDPLPLKLPKGWNFGEVLGIAINSKGEIVVLNHPGTATAGPIYGNATTNLWKFNAKGAYVEEIGGGVYGFAYGHSVRFDKDDNLWYVDKASNSVVKFNPEGRVIMNLGRRDEGFDSFEHVNRPKMADAKGVDGLFNGATDVAFDPDGDIFISEGYVNNRIDKFNKDGDWIKAFGQYGSGGPAGDQNPGNFSLAHNIQADRAGNIYVADRYNRRIQVFDKDGNFRRFLQLNAPYDKSRHPTLGNMPANRPDQTEPWALCITNTPMQYLYVVDSEPTRLYKMTLDGKILAMVSSSGRRDFQMNWPHALACPSENVVWVADMNNWAVKKFTLYPERVAPPR